MSCDDCSIGSCGVVAVALAAVVLATVALASMSCCNESVEWCRQALVWVLWPGWLSEEALVGSQLGAVAGRVVASWLSSLATAASAMSRNLQGFVAERLPWQ